MDGPGGKRGCSRMPWAVEERRTDHGTCHTLIEVLHDWFRVVGFPWGLLCVRRPSAASSPCPACRFGPVWFVVLVEDESMPKIIVNAFLTQQVIPCAAGMWHPAAHCTTLRWSQVRIREAHSFSLRQPRSDC